MSDLRKYPLVLAVICASALSSAEAAGSTLFSYPGFADTSGLTFAGNAATASTSDGTALRLTPATSFQSSAAYSTSAIELGNNATFSTQFQFRFTGGAGVGPADGITFVLAANASGLGATGGALAYQYVNNSVAVEFDTFGNGSGDGNSSNHVAIDTDGNLNVLGLANVYGIRTCTFSSSTPHTAAGCMSNGDLWTANVSYDGSKLSVNVLDPAKGVMFTAINSYPINIASHLGSNTAYVGFTGSTGGGYQNQDIVNWRFADTSSSLPTSSPEPPTLLLLASTLLPLVCVYKRAQSKAR